MPLTATLDGLALNAAPYFAHEPLQTGAADLARVLLRGDLRLEEYDQYLAETRFRRTIRLPLQIRSSTMDGALANQQAIIAKLTAANVYAPKDLVVTGLGAGETSTFKVVGGNLDTDYTRKFENNKVDDCVLELECLPWCYGPSEALGSSGAPLVTDTSSPAAFTVTPTAGKEGDGPADVTVFLKIRGTSLTSRGMIVGAVSANTTWTCLSDSSTWTLDAGTRDTTDSATKNTDKITFDATVAGTIYQVAHFTAPTLPTDRAFRIILRCKDVSTGTRGSNQFRVRLVSGQTEVAGEWRVADRSATSTTWVGSDLGPWLVPPGEVSAAGAAATTVYIEQRTFDTTALAMHYDFVEFWPDDSMLTVETIDTAKALGVTGDILRVESDNAYTNAGVPIGGAVFGAHVRFRGSSRVNAHLAQGYLAALDATGWDYQNLDAWAAYQPRYIHLA